MTTSKTEISIRELIKRPACFLGLGFGVGLIPFAPGTFGTLIAIPVYLLMQNLSLIGYLLLTLLALIAGVWLCQQSANYLGKNDPAAVVWDEIAGYLVTMIAAPEGWQWIITGFVLFRFFDIIKPWPISWFDKNLHGGLGIMADDIIAGIFAWLIMQLLALSDIMT